MNGKDLRQSRDDEGRKHMPWMPRPPIVKGDLGIERRGGHGGEQTMFLADDLSPAADAGIDAIVCALHAGQVTAADVNCEPDQLEAALDWLASVRLLH